MNMDLFHTGRPWESPEIQGEGRLPMRSPLLPYPSAQEALAASFAGPLRRREGDDPWYLCLDGKWRFALADNPESAPSDFPGDSFDDSSWASIAVPGTWTLQGYDKPHYTNVVMPFGNVPPSAPASHNPTGLYRMPFDLPSGWEGRRVVLHVGGAESFLEAWCNGSRLGFSKDTRLPSEFDITRYAKSGRNLLAFRVIRYSDSSFIEDQDQWWYGGIYRGVYLYSTDFAYLADLDLRPSLAEDFSSGRLDVAARLGFTFDPTGGKVPVETAAVDYPGASAGGSPGLPAGAREAAYVGAWRVKLALYETEGSAPLAATEGAVDPYYRASSWTARLSLPVDRPRLWSHESPSLYRLVASLVSPEGLEVEHIASSLGFRRVEVRDRKLLINGERVLIKGVNRHEHDERMGKTLRVEDMVRDIEIMKRHNFNAVRLSHYPNDERWYELCDEYGLYLYDEADIESHAYYDQVCRDPRWSLAFIERGSRMVLRDKNHPSIIVWSLGNESGYGPNHDMLSAWIRSFDPSRPVHYEGAFRPEWGQGRHDLETLKRGRAASDIVSTMYSPLELLDAWSRTTEDERPFILCEFSHAMGNSNGGLSDYWELIESRPGLQGGFIWDWVDQGLEAFDANGKKYWKYGGDFGDAPSDLDFICNGLVFPDRSEKPVLAECAKLFQSVSASSEHPLSGKVTIRNKRDFSSLGDLSLRWAIQVDGETLLSGEDALPAIGPGESAEIELGIAWTEASRRRAALGECFLFLEFLSAVDRPWAPAGHRVGWEQIPVSSEVACAGASAGRHSVSRNALCETVTSAALPAGRRASIEASGGCWEARGPGYEARFSTEGLLSSLSFGSGELLASPLRMSLWRVPTENDGLKTFMRFRGIEDFKWYCEGKAMYPWLEAGLDEIRLSLEEARADSGAEVSAEGPGLSIAHEAFGRTGRRLGRFVQDWRFGPEGPLCSFFFDLESSLPELPKVGLELALAEGVERARWYGRGPQECYSDRKAGAAIGIYESRIDDLWVPYVLPQECGNRTELRWLELLGPGTGLGLRVESDGLFDFSASRFDPKNVWEAAHTCDLVRKLQAFLCIDVAQRGLGTATCGPDTRERYKVPAGPYALELSLSAP